MFAMRFVVQWIASERAGKRGADRLLDFLDRRRLAAVCSTRSIADPVFIMGQGFGVFVYARNLFFELRDRRAAGITRLSAV